MEQAPYLDKYIDLFRKEMAEPDSLQQVVLKGHLIIESALENIISIIFFHPEYVHKGRFGFEHKVRLARAYGLRKDQNSIWNLILSINAVRNEVAHNLAGEKRDQKLSQLRRLFEREASDEMRAELAKLEVPIDEAPDELVITYSCALCTGFLGTFEADVSALRRMIDQIDLILNPDAQGA